MKIKRGKEKKLRSVFSILIIISIISIIQYAHAQEEDFRVDNVTPQVVKTGSTPEFEVTGTGFEDDTHIGIYPDFGTKGYQISAWSKRDPLALSVEKDRLYAAFQNTNLDGCYIKIIDISDPKHPDKELGTCSIPQLTIITDIDVKKGMAYVLGKKLNDPFNGGSPGDIILLIIDLSDPAAPVHKSSFPMDQQTTEVYHLKLDVQGAVAYAVYNRSLWIINIADPENPINEGVYSPDNNSDSYHKFSDIEVMNSTAFVTAQNDGLHAIDVSKPAAPVLDGYYKHADGDSYSAVSISADGGTAYLADSSNRIMVLDIKKTSEPNFKGDLPLEKAAVEITMQQNALYVTYSQENDMMTVVDVSTPENPVITGSYSFATDSGVQCAVQGDTAYITTGIQGLKIIDISNPQIPPPSSVPELTYAEDVAIEGNTACILGNFGLSVMDISDPKNPLISGSMPFASGNSGYNAIAMQGDKAYIAANTKKLLAINVSDPNAPYEMGDYGISKDYIPWIWRYKITAEGNTVYVANTDGFLVIDADDPSDMNLMYEFETECKECIRDIAVQNSQLYMITDNYQLDGMLLHVIDMTQPSNPIKKGVLSLGKCTDNFCTDLESIDVKGNTAYVAAGFGGLLIVNVSDPSAPKLIGELSTKPQGAALNLTSHVTVHDDKAYVADESGTVLVLDLKDPENPVVTHSYDIFGRISGIAGRGDTVCAANGGMGLYISQLLKTDITYRDSNKIMLSLQEEAGPGNYTLKAYSQNRIINKPGIITIIGRKAVNKAIIVAGGNPGGEENKIRKETDEAAKRAYDALRHQGYAAGDIYYLGPENTPAAAEYGDITPENLEWAVTEWAKQDRDSTDATTDLILFIVGHGGNGIFKLRGNEEVTSAELDSWLDRLQTDVPELERVTFIYDSCQSGSFSDVRPPAGKERIVITSTEADQPAYFLGNGALSFSYQFWNEIYNGAALGEAFGLAKERMSQFQTARMDADADGLVNEAEDIGIAEGIKILRGYAQDTYKPYIFYAEVPGAEKDSNTFVLRAKVSAAIRVRAMHDRNGEPMDKVWAIIKPPGFTAGSPDVPVTDLPVVELEHTGNAYYEGWHEDFSEKGEYTVTILARNKSGLTGLPLDMAIVQEIGVQITAVSEPQALNGTSTAAIWAEIPAVTQGADISRVEAVITFPGQAGKGTMRLSGPDANGRFEGIFNGFTETGLYAVSISAFTSEGFQLGPVKTAYIRPESQSGEPDLYEPDNSQDQAKVININDKDPQTHGFHNASDTDWVKVYGIENEGYKIRVDKLGTLFNPAISIYDASGQPVINPVNKGGPGETEETYWICGQTGIHYIRVENTTPVIFGENATYELEIYRPIGQLLGYLAGRIVDASGSPVPGAKIRTNANATALSRSQGYFLLTQKPGEFSVTIEADGYNASTQDITIKEGEATELGNITLVSSGPVDTQPVAAITHPESDITVNVGDTVNFSGSVSNGNAPFTYAWSFDGAADNSAILSPGDVTFDTPGTYKIIFTVTDKDKDTSDAAITVTVQDEDTTPEAKIISPAADITLNAGATVEFNGRATGGNPPLAISWDFGGQAEPSDLENPGGITFKNKGTYTVTLTVTDTDGDKASDEITVTVMVEQADTRPVVSILSPAADAAITAGESIAFRGFASGGDAPLTYLWNFGGAAPDSTLSEPGDIRFDTPGTYEITFTATDADGDNSRAVITVTVSAYADTQPVASINFPDSDVSVAAGASVDFRGAVSGGNPPFSFSWDFDGQAAPSNLETPGSISFKNTGVFTVTFTATDNDGDTASASVVITVSMGLHTPEPVYPSAGETEVPLTPTFRTSEFTHLNTGFSHAKTRWQIASDAGFTNIVLDITSEIHLTSFTPPPLLLEAGRTFYWRAQFFDNEGNASSWSVPAAFTTAEATKDADGNGVPDSQQAAPDADADGNGVSDISQSGMVTLTSSTGGFLIGIQSDAGINSVTSSNTAAEQDSRNRPASMPAGVVAFSLAAENKGDAVTVTVYFEPGVSVPAWYDHQAETGWTRSTGAVFALNGKQVTLTVQDGGPGDADGTENGVIIITGGPASASAGLTNSPPGGGAGCFVSALGAKSPIGPYFPLILLFTVVCGFFVLKNETGKGKRA